MLTHDQLKANIAALEQQGASQQEIQSWLDSLKPQSSLAGETPTQAPSITTPSFLEKTSVGKFGTTLGTALAGPMAASSIGQSQVSEATSRFNLAKQLRTATPEQAVRIRSQLGQGPKIPTATEQIPALQKTGGQVAGEALGTLGTVALGMKPAASRAVRMATGSILGAGAGLKTGLETGATPLETAKKMAVGAGIGLGVAGAGEVIGSVLNKVFNHFSPGAVINREFKPPVKEVAADVERGFKTFGEQAAAVTDESGKAIYQGTPKQILEVAKNDITKQGQLLDEKVAAVSDSISVDKSALTKPVFQKIQDEYGALSQSEANAVRAEFGRINKQVLNGQDLLDFKRQIDSKIPDNFWSKLSQGDRTTAIATYAKYLLRDGLRTALNDASGDAEIQAINNRLSIGMDMRRLAALRVAKGMLAELPKSLVGLIERALDNTIFSPAVTTRLGPLAAKAGQISQAVGPTAITKTAATEAAASLGTR